MKKIIRVTESDLIGIVKQAINEIYSEKDMGRGEEIGKSSFGMDVKFPKNFRREKSIIKNGDVFDIGQTVNGISKFLWFNEKWYYFEEIFTREYEYDQKDLTNLVTENEFDEVTHLGNILETFKSE